MKKSAIVFSMAANNPRVVVLSPTSLLKSIPTSLVPLIQSFTSSDNKVSSSERVI